jgi:phage terminase small subunit
MRNSNEEKIKRGTFKPSRAKSVPKKGTLLVNEVEAEIELSSEAKIVFKDVSDILQSRDAMESYDIHMVTLLALEYDEVFKLRNSEATDFGKVSAERKVKDKCIDNIIKLSRSLNITPIARSGIKKSRPGTLSSQKSDDPLSDFI